MIPKKIRRNDLARSLGIPLYRAVAWSVFYYPPPRVLVNGIPKAGLHLLEALLSRFPKMMHSGVHLTANDYSARPVSEMSSEEITDGENGSISWDQVSFRKRLKQIRNGQFVTCHLPAIPRLLAVPKELGYKHLLIIRDPRDIVVSGAFYPVDRTGHPHSRRFAEDFTTIDSRIMAVIRGFPTDEKGPGRQDIGVRLASYLPLLADPSVHVMSFESLIGARGGGDPVSQRREVEDVARHLERDLTTSEVDVIVERTWSSNSATFRKGSIGGWREHFTEEHKGAFKTVAGDLLIGLGYEDDSDW